MRSVLISTKPRWCAKIANKIKPVEIRKTKPNLQTPFRCLIYCTKGDPNDPHERLELHDADGKIHLMNGHVIGEFICSRIEQVTKDNKNRIAEMSCVPLPEMYEYAGTKGLEGLYAWHISNLIIYDKPKDIGDFKVRVTNKIWSFTKKLERAPQSWCYIEEETK